MSRSSVVRSSLRWAFAVALIAVVLVGGTSVSGCMAGDPEDLAPQPVTGLFDGNASFLSDPTPQTDAEILAAFRNHRRSQPRPPLFLLASTSAMNDPNAVMTDGFALWGYPPFPVQPPIDWQANPFADESWRYQLNTLLFLDPLLQACDESPDPTFLTFAVAVARDWLSQNWTKEGNANQFAWYDMAVGVRATKFAWLVDAAACSPDINDDALTELLQGALRHGQELRDPSNLAGDMNHGIYQMLGLLGLVETLPEMRGFGEYQTYALTTVEQMFTSHYCEAEGAHLEHSPAYHLYVTHLLANALSTGLVVGPRLQALQDKAFSVLTWMIKPDGSITRFGDGQDNRLPVGRDVLPAALRPHYPEYWFALTGGEEGMPPPQEELILKESGYAFIRAPRPAGPDQWATTGYLSFAAGFHSCYHKHADDGTIEWSELDHSLLIDSGPFGYHYQLPERRYCESTRAHNTLEIDGQDTPRNPEDVFGSALRRWAKADDTYALEADFPYKQGVEHRRTLLYAPGKWLVVADDLTADQAHEYTQWFHFDPELDLTRMEDRFILKLPRSRQRLLVQSLAQADGLSLRTVRGQTEPRLEGWTSLAYKQLTPSWAAAYTRSGKDVLLVTLLALGDEEQVVRDPVVLSSRDQGRLDVAWSSDTGRVQVHITRSGDNLKLEVSW